MRFNSEPPQAYRQLPPREQREFTEAFRFGSEPSPQRQGVMSHHLQRLFQPQHNQQGCLQHQLRQGLLHGNQAKVLLQNVLAERRVNFGKFGSEQTASSTEDGGDVEHFSLEEFEDEYVSVLNHPFGQPVGQIKTTLMVRNIPVMYTQDMLMLEWPNNGCYNFLYLPRSCAGQTNLSYAFINFCSEEHAMAFRLTWQKRRLAHFRARKSLNISLADIQGLKAHLQQLKKKRVRRIEMRQCQPFIMLEDRVIGLMEALASLDNIDWDALQ